MCFSGFIDCYNVATLLRFFPKPPISFLSNTTETGGNGIKKTRTSENHRWEYNTFQLIIINNPYDTSHIAHRTHRTHEVIREKRHTRCAASDGTRNRTEHKIARNWERKIKIHNDNRRIMGFNANSVYRCTRWFGTLTVRYYLSEKWFEIAAALM